jgi:hypothetical protein
MELNVSVKRFIPALLTLPLLLGATSTEASSPTRIDTPDHYFVCQPDSATDADHVVLTVVSPDGNATTMSCSQEPPCRYMTGAGVCGYIDSDNPLLPGMPATIDMNNP